MDYGTYTANLDQENHCPFCRMSDDEILDETENFYAVLARAPYVKDHILIISKRHVTFLNELTKEEQQEMWDLVNTRNTFMQEEHEGTSILLRDTHAKGIS
jgi:diadenosine tetraphosphate (Ap4A) HIT family hydrolase